jgi:hypothetical protein
LEGEPTVQGRRRCLSASRQTIAPAWGAGRMRTERAIGEQFHRRAFGI